MAKAFGAAYHGKADKLRRILEAEDPALRDCPSVAYTDKEHSTALHAACQQGHEACARLLIEAGAVVDARGASGTTPLMAACENGHAACAHHLIRAGADASIADDDNSATALHGAAGLGHAGLVSMLLDSKAPVDACDYAGATPLIIASHQGHAACVRMLCRAGADKTIEFQCCDAHRHALANGHTKCADILEGNAEAIEAADDDIDEAAVALENEVEAIAKKAGAKASSRPDRPSESASGASSDASSDGATGASPKESPKESPQESPKESPKVAAAEPPKERKPVVLDLPKEVLEGDSNYMMSTMARALDAKGVKGTDLFRKKEAELNEAEREARRREEAEAARKAAEAEARARKPNTSYGAKLEANSLFSQGKIAEAAEMYTHAIGLAKSEPEEEAADVEAVVVGTPLASGPPQRAVLQCNLAACRLRQRRWKDAVAACDAACALHPGYTKALFRRAQANRAMKCYQSAVDDAAAAMSALSADGEPVGDHAQKTCVGGRVGLQGGPAKSEI